MKVNKSKRIETILDCNSRFRRQRSSLKVNLSCDSNLQNSNNASLERIDTGSDIDNGNFSSNIPLKNVSIILEKIDKDNATLHKNCETLKNTIVAKTKQIFLEQDELSIKTCTILSTKNGKSSLNQSIGSTVRDECKNKNISNQEKQNRLKKRQLFKHVNNTNNNDDKINSKCHTSEQWMLQSNSNNYSSSNMLTKKYEISNNSNEINRHRINCSIVCKGDSLCTSKISEGENAFTVVPIGCSTMIDNKVSDIENDVYFQNANNLPLNNINCKLRLSGKSLETDSVNTVQTSLNVNTSVDVENQNNKSTNKYKWENHKKKKCASLENTLKGMHSIVLQTQESINTISTSLQMNTSLDISNQLQKSNIVDFTMKDISLMGNEKDIFNSCNTENNNFNDQKVKNCKMQQQDQIVLHKDHTSECSGIVNNTIILNNSCCEMSHVQTQTSVNVEKSTNTSESKKDRNMKHLVSFSDKGQSKRKLLPLGECSQLASFSPVQKECSPLGHLILRKKHKKRRNKCNKKFNINNIEQSEGKENQDYNEKKQIKKPKKVISKKIVVKKIVDEDILKKLEENKDNFSEIETDVCTLKRSSTNDFQSLKRSSRKQIQRINIVATGLSNEDKDVVKSVVGALGLAKIESNVTKRTTHVVSTGVRTVNLLHGIIRGCWIVSLEWVLKSLENDAWLNPENYEMAHFSKAVLENRKDRQLFGKAYISELFTACGYINVQKSTTPPCDVLKGLIKAAGGCITENPETAKILIGVGGLKEAWVLDCITLGELQPCNQYQRPSID
ncbi:Microcephalin [Habropoda laboriosa]|uniref:Microcephalin n=1 Tax=Habropoda laboriosa TaxID=597456 RepID=A0A0L7R0G7_9HYME|nr:PREDICTED: putative uncharacterized protein DDB_G0282133 [Habropoda laboriosa]KOC64335.1 Microcephalin [Habropoda laboriosa]